MSNSLFDLSQRTKNLKQKKNKLYTPMFRRILLPGLIFMLVLGWSVFALRIRPGHFFDGLPHFFNLVSEMFPPNWEVLTRGRVLFSVLEVLSMAFLGTFIGGLCAFFLALPASGSLSQSGSIRAFFKGLLAFERSIPSLIIALLLIVVIGLGPFTGLVTVAIGSIGMLGKMFADAIENVDPKPLESLKSTGATKIQIIRYAVLPQVIPSFIANTLFRFDINLRVALFLGVIGGGGIGFEIHVAMSLFRYDDALAITALTLAVIWLAEKTSDYLRRRIIGKEILQ